MIKGEEQLPSAEEPRRLGLEVGNGVGDWGFLVWFVT